MQNLNSLRKNIKSLDRLFPNENGDYGSLIAMPFQGKRAQEGKTVFVDQNFEMSKKQIDVLQSIQRMTPAEVDAFVHDCEEMEPAPVKTRTNGSGDPVLDDSRPNQNWFRNFLKGKDPLEDRFNMACVAWDHGLSQGVTEEIMREHGCDADERLAEKVAGVYNGGAQNIQGCKNPAFLFANVEAGEKTQATLNVIERLASEIHFGTLNPIEFDARLKAIRAETGTLISTLKLSVKTALSNLRKQLAEPKDDYTDSEIQAAEELLIEPNLFKKYHEEFKLTRYRADINMAASGLLFLGRTLLSTSSALYAYGRSSSGKSEFISAVTKFFPQSRVENLTKITPAFLFRAGGSDGKRFAHKVLVFGEMRPVRPGEDDRLQEAIRQLVSENRLSQGSVDDVDGQRNVATNLVLHGPVVIGFTGIHSPSDWDDQLINRSYCQQFKHSQESIRNVLHAKANSGPISSNPTATDSGELAKAERKWQAAFSLLKPVDPDAALDCSPVETAGSNSDSIQLECKQAEDFGHLKTSVQSVQRVTQECAHVFHGVLILFLEMLVFKKKRLTESDMRAFEMLKNLIATSALLHQRTRDIRTENGKTFLVATWEDYVNVRDVFLDSVPRTAQALSNDLLNRFEELLDWWGKPENAGVEKTKAEIAAALDMSLPNAKRLVYSWCDADLLRKDDFPARAASDRKTYYLPTEDAVALVAAMREMGDLKIERSAYTCVNSVNTRFLSTEKRRR